jgi:hypothetical protein
MDPSILHQATDSTGQGVVFDMNTTNGMGGYIDPMIFQSGLYVTAPLTNKLVKSYDYPMIPFLFEHPALLCGVSMLNEPDPQSGQPIDVDVENVYTIRIPSAGAVQDILHRLFESCCLNNTRKPTGIYAHAHPTDEQICEINREYRKNRNLTRLDLLENTDSGGNTYTFFAQRAPGEIIPCCFLNFSTGSGALSSTPTEEELFKYILYFYILRGQVNDDDKQSVSHDYFTDGIIFKGGLKANDNKTLSIKSRTKTVMWVTMTVGVDSVSTPVVVIRLHMIEKSFDQVRSEDVGSILMKQYGTIDLNDILQRGGGGATFQLARYLHNFDTSLPEFNGYSIVNCDAPLPTL